MRKRDPDKDLCEDIAKRVGSIVKSHIKSGSAATYRTTDASEYPVILDAIKRELPEDDFLGFVQYVARLYDEERSKVVLSQEKVDYKDIAWEMDYLNRGGFVDGLGYSESLERL